MNILIICDYYPPDSSIAAVRPYMLAKYLAANDHKITVLRSGELSNIPDNSLGRLEHVQVISLFGENSSAERFERGENVLVKQASRRLEYLPKRIRNIIAKVYKFAIAPWHIYKLYCEKNYRISLLNSILKNKLSNEHVDIVLSTCGNSYIIAEGEQAACFFGCKWIVDFRDPLVQSASNGYLLNKVFRYIQNRTVKKADCITAVSDGVLQTVSCGCSNSKLYTIYNGYDDFFDKENHISSCLDTKKLIFCYTGRIYDAQQEAFICFAKILRNLVEEKLVCLEYMRFVYAGPDSVLVRNILRDAHLEDILIDKGYISRNEARRVQLGADIFIVLSWNNKNEKGVLTGKFYEGIRARKVILTMVAGNSPNSELYKLNEKYSYGFCYEVCRQSVHLKDFIKFLTEVYTEKKKLGVVSFKGRSSLITDFRYDNITCKLEQICSDLLQR